MTEIERHAEIIHSFWLFVLLWSLTRLSLHAPSRHTLLSPPRQCTVSIPHIHKLSSSFFYILILVSTKLESFPSTTRGERVCLRMSTMHHFASSPPHTTVSLPKHPRTSLPFLPFAPHASHPTILYIFTHLSTLSPNLSTHHKGQKVRARTTLPVRKPCLASGLPPRSVEHATFPAYHEPTLPSGHIFTRRNP